MATDTPEAAATSVVWESSDFMPTVKVSVSEAPAFPNVSLA
jgi:hypothetical protein